MNAFRMLSVVLLGVVPLVGAGCSSGLVTVPVTGTVRYRGEPLPGAAVIFRAPRPGAAASAPASMIMATATTDAAGRFAVVTTLGGSVAKRGAVVGRHKVIISKYVPPAGMTEARYQELLQSEAKAMNDRGFTTEAERAPARVELLPARYADAAATTLEADVTAGKPNDFTFDLKD
ncbi:MAG: hypothetical protein EBZ59_11445 [Planctomycetia bacterium]|nr:hypothetical protein [Planctomycetia bacterium]